MNYHNQIKADLNHQDSINELKKVETSYANGQDLRNRAIKAGNDPAYVRGLTRTQQRRADKIKELRAAINAYRYE